jgi:aldehyde dehydrogenase (NAD+)
MAAKRIWGKFINAGQTCIAPDYIMIQKDMKSKFIDYMITAAYSNKPEESLILLELSMLKLGRLTAMIDNDKVILVDNLMNRTVT